MRRTPISVAVRKAGHRITFLSVEIRCISPICAPLYFFIHIRQTSKRRTLPRSHIRGRHSKFINVIHRFALLAVHNGNRSQSNRARPSGSVDCALVFRRILRGIAAVQRIVDFRIVVRRRQFYRRHAFIRTRSNARRRRNDTVRNRIYL